MVVVSGILAQEFLAVPSIVAVLYINQSKEFSGDDQLFKIAVI